jgi:Polysulphide reductase, NrfD
MTAGPRGVAEPVPAEFRSYYGRPVLKPPAWNWTVPAYLFTGGLSAGSTLLAAGADLTGRPALRRVGRLGALASLTVSAGLLIADLGRPERFHHMLRVAKPTSPMSVGSWILTAYTPGVALAAAAELLPRRAVAGRDAVVGRGVLAGRDAVVGRGVLAGRDAVVGRGVLAGRDAVVGRGVLAGRGGRGGLGGLLRAVARPAALSSAAAAPAVASYTAVLLSQTAVPAWHEAHPYLPFVFTGSAAASAGGLGMVLAPRHEAGPARAFAAYGALSELAASTVMTSRLGLVSEAYRTGTAGRLRTWSERLTLAGLAGTLVAGRSRAAAVASGLALLAGSALQRFAVFEAGVASTKDPKYVVIPQRQRLDQRRHVQPG